ncbi:MAG: N-6 DNA methylase [Rickettsiales bacterium]|jgi:hypothetical protein|nr:N-6 DNA methylase [Rickettsiales bacterium]
MEQIKSKKRVKDLGEVFTPENIVWNMCELIPDKVWKNVSETFFEPSCGTGNFIVEILKRKLKFVKSNVDFLRAISSIYGVDIMEDNIIETKGRMHKLLSEFNELWYKNNRYFIGYIIDKNIICGNSLNYKYVNNNNNNEGELVNDKYIKFTEWNFDDDLIDGDNGIGGILKTSETYYYEMVNEGEKIIESEEKHAGKKVDVRKEKVENKEMKNDDLFAFEKEKIAFQKMISDNNENII